MKAKQIKNEFFEFLHQAGKSYSFQVNQQIRGKLGENIIELKGNVECLIYVKVRSNQPYRWGVTRNRINELNKSEKKWILVLLYESPNKGYLLLKKEVNRYIDENIWPLANDGDYKVTSGSYLRYNTPFHSFLEFFKLLPDIKEELRPNEAEIEFLTLAYNRLYDIYEEVMDDSFWGKSKWYRFSKIKEGFAIYTELLNYEPIKWVIEQIKKSRPPMEAEIGSELFKFIRNIITHFPFFESWDEVWVSKSLINWYKEGQSIDKFLNKYKCKNTVKYRFWEAKKKKMTYLSINFPQKYDDKVKVYLKEILSEKEGVKFSFILMKQIIDTQVEK